MVAFDITWTWVIVLVGALVGLCLAVLAMIVDLPSIVLILLSAVAGASATTFGIMLLAGAIDSEDLTAGEITSQVDNDWWWYAIYVVLLLVGVVLQTRSTEALRASMRENWESQRRGAATS
jgi:hypothetical protein